MGCKEFSEIPHIEDKGELLKRRRIKEIRTKVIATSLGGLVFLIGIVGAIAFDIANKYFNAPRSYDAEGRPAYIQMISDATNNKEGYRKAKFGSFVNACGGFDSEEEMETYYVDLESTLEDGLCKRIVEIPDEKTIERGLENVTKYVKSDGTKVSSFNDSGKEYWLEVHAFDRDEIKGFEVYEIDPGTNEEIRKIDVGNTSSANTKWGKYMAETYLDFDESGVGNAKLLRLDITDKKDNRYHSFIELEEKI